MCDKDNKKIEILQPLFGIVPHTPTRERPSLRGRELRRRAVARPYRARPPGPQSGGLIPYTPYPIPGIISSLTFPLSIVVSH